jgi:hypothetical protein
VLVREAWQGTAPIQPAEGDRLDDLR